MLIYHIKGYPDPSMYVKSKGVSLLTLAVQHPVVAERHCRRTGGRKVSVGREGS